MNGIGNGLRAISRKITKFLRNNIIQQLYCELLTFVMANIGDHNLPIGVKKFVVFVIGCHKELGAGGFGRAEQKSAGPSAEGHCFHIAAQQARVSNAAGLHCRFQMF